MTSLDERDAQPAEDFFACLVERVHIALEEISKLPLELRETRDSSFWGATTVAHEHPSRPQVSGLGHLS